MLFCQHVLPFSGPGQWLPPENGAGGQRSQHISVTSADSGIKIRTDESTTAQTVQTAKTLVFFLLFFCF